MPRHRAKAQPLHNLKIGAVVRLPGLPGRQKVEDVSGARGMVSWTSSKGEVIRGEVFLSQLQPADWYQRKTGFIEKVGEPIPPPFLHEEGWDLPLDG